MSYSEVDGQVILTMSREDYDKLLIELGRAMSLHATQGGTELAALTWISRMERELDWMNRLNSGNPNYTPYQVEAEKK